MPGPITGGQRSPFGPLWQADKGWWIVIPGDALKMDSVGVSIKRADEPSGSTGTEVIHVNTEHPGVVTQPSWPD